jgi:hypothetical protein
MRKVKGGKTSIAECPSADRIAEPNKLVQLLMKPRASSSDIGRPQDKKPAVG